MKKSQDPAPAQWQQAPWEETEDGQVKTDQGEELKQLSRVGRDNVGTDLGCRQNAMIVNWCLLGLWVKGVREPHSQRGKNAC